MLSQCRQVFVAFFHTSSCISKYGLTASKARPAVQKTSRKQRQSLKEKWPTRTLLPALERDEPPHVTIELQKPKERRTSYRRRTEESSQRDWQRRTREYFRTGWASEISGLKGLANPPESPMRFRSFSTTSASRSSPANQPRPPPPPRTQQGSNTYTSKLLHGKQVIKLSPVDAQTIPAIGTDNKSINPGLTLTLSEILQPSPSQSVTPGSHKSLPRIPKFTAPPLTAPFIRSLTNLLGPTASPTEIQSLALGSMLSQEQKHNQYLLSSETGSGKSIAYLLPILQSLKQTDRAAPTGSLPIQPRLIIVTPTHELCRQTALFAKALCASPDAHLRVQCLSSNLNNLKFKSQGASGNDMTPSKMKKIADACSSDTSSSEFSVTPDSMGRQTATVDGTGSRPVDVVVGTPMKIMELIRGRGWNMDSKEGEEGKDGNVWKALGRRGYQLSVRNEGLGKKYMGLEDVEWVVIDEADTLFDPDFQETTRLILSDVSSARGVEVKTPDDLHDPSLPSPSPASPPQYPFSIALSTATLPSYLLSYLSTYHPNMRYLISEGVHRFPPGLDVEYSTWRQGGQGSQLADVERRIRQVWIDDQNATTRSGNTDGKAELSKILLFLNRSYSANKVSQHLTEKGIPNLVFTGKSEQRRVKSGSNQIKGLAGFLKEIPRSHSTAEEEEGLEDDKEEQKPLEEQPVKLAPPPVQTLLAQSASGQAVEKQDDGPRVLVTNSLLSRGLDFSPSIKYVFVVEEPRNYVDVLHRAGRIARAGNKGKVIFFGDFGDKLTTLRGGLRGGFLVGSRNTPRQASKRATEIRKRIEEMRR